MPYATPVACSVSSIADGHKPDEIGSRGGHHPAGSLPGVLAGPGLKVGRGSMQGGGPRGRESVVPAKSPLLSNHPTSQ
jgi:hypothetical protein